jgi:5'-3' exonuclease
VKNYGTIESIYEHLNEFSPDLKDKLVQDRESAFFSKHLIELMCVDDLSGASLDDYILAIDFNKWEDILLKKWQFNTV